MIAPEAEISNERRKVIVIVGPTAVGKTSLSIEIAKTLGGEIVSADSRQVYRGLDIGSGKVTKDEMEGIPHHLIDVEEPHKIFTAAKFVQLARKAIHGILERGHVPIVVGGTGFYVDALLGRISLAEVPPNNTLREELSALTLAKLNARLIKLDPERAATVDTKNRARLVRAIEIATALGFVPKPKPEPLYDTLWIGLALPRDELAKRIHRRLTERLDAGMLDEARRLHAHGLTWKRMEELGLEYRYISRNLKGELGYEEMVLQLEREIVRLAKRQMTWFKKNKSIRWFEPRDVEGVAQYALKFISG